MQTHHWHISIGHAVIHVDCNVPACMPILDAMLRLYKTAEPNQPASVHFQFEQQQSFITLIANEQVLWQGYNPEETVAGFEVHFYGYVLAAIEPKLISIHAATVAVDKQAIMLAGISGAGKSSSCTAALLAGADYLSDEFALLDKTGFISPFPRPLQWGKQRHPAFLHADLIKQHFKKFSFRFPDFEQQQRYTLFWFPPRICQQVTPLKAIIFPSYDKHTTQTIISPMLRSQALMELTKHLHHQYSPAKCIQELNQRIPKDIPFLQVRFPDVCQAWQDIRQALKL